MQTADAQSSKKAAATAKTSEATKPAYKRNLPDSLARHAKVSESDAITTAKKQVAGGKLQAIELEREGGKLIYSMELKVSGKSGVEEVNVDATTGALIAKEHESPAKEKAEAKADKAAAKKAPVKKP
jgi:uncharacterized membrane protein YkoI